MDLNLFDTFWKVYPKKVDKAESQKLFDKLDEPTQKMIIEDVIKRSASHSQWTSKKFVPSPARYLRRQLWNDEFIKDPTKEEEQASNEDGSIHARFWTMLIQMYGKKFETSFGSVMPIAWRSGLRKLTEIQAGKILNYLANDPNEYMPDLPRICMLRRYSFEEPTDKFLPKPERNPELIDKSFKTLKGILKY